MTWLNPPASEHYDEGALTVRSKGKTDFWRKTFYGYVTDNGHFMHLPMIGEFTLQARVNGNYSQLYDQAGLMVRLDEKHWMKCGSEFFEGKRWASVVFTHDFSDWSTMEDLSQTGAVWWRVVRKKDSIEAQCSKDGEKFMTIRQGYFPAGGESDGRRHVRGPRRPGFRRRFRPAHARTQRLIAVSRLLTRWRLVSASTFWPFRLQVSPPGRYGTGREQPATSPRGRQRRPETASAERRNLADALAHERNVLRTMIDLIPAFIYAKDAQSRFTACNKLVANRMGVDPDGAHRQDRFRFLPARDGGEILRRRAGADQVRRAALSTAKKSRSTRRAAWTA